MSDRCPEAAPSTRILRKPEVLSMLGVSHMWLERAWRVGRFPKPVHISPRCVGWLSTEVEEWLQARAAERDARPPAANPFDDIDFAD